MMKSPNRRTAFLLGLIAAVYSGRSLGADKVTAIIHGTLVHPEKGASLEPDVTIIVAGDRIQAVGPSKSTPAPKGATVLNAQGKWILPGLIDSHVHFFQSGNPFTRPDAIDATKIVPYDKEVQRNKARLPATFKVWLASGVTSVADVGGPFWNFEVRDAARKSSAAPRVAIAGPLTSMIDRPQLDLGDPPIIKISSPEAARQLAQKELSYKPDFLKVWFIHRQGDDLAAQEAIVKATGDAAHAAGIRLAVHATELDVAKAALRAGADILVHSVLDKPIDAEFLELAKTRKAIYVPTLFVRDGYSLLIFGEWKPTEPEQRLGDPQILAHMNDLEKVPKEQLPARLQELRKRGRPQTKVFGMDNLRPVWDAGIPVAMGTDAGNAGTLHGPSIFREMQLMRDAGLTMPEILLSATVNGAKVMGMERDLGSVAPGKLADLVVLDADPLASVDNLSRVHWTIKGGAVFEPAKLMQSIR
ncbi:MAG TPA: amidohydrolase family protein [Myxococcaceae bacterium]|nr:amidohydrolase family protein [Myxococcaceae bacterium]